MVIREDHVARFSLPRMTDISITPRYPRCVDLNKRRTRQCAQALFLYNARSLNAQIWQVRWLHGETDVCSTFDAQMKQISPSSASSAGAAAAFLPLSSIPVVGPGVGCPVGSGPESLLGALRFCLSRPPPLRGPVPLDLESFPAPSVDCCEFSILAEGWPAPRPRPRRPPRFGPCDPEPWVG